MIEQIIDYIYIIPCALCAIILHELSHGLASTMLGDPTPKATGRLSLNPKNHLDLMGLFCLIIFHVGWAKPVRVDSRYYKNPKWGMAFVALAGPLMNFVIAFLAALFYVLTFKFTGNNALVLLKLFYYLMIINIGLGLFNLIPLPPLDGSKILAAVLPDQAYYQVMKYERYGMFFLFAIIILMDVLESRGLPNILNTALEFVANGFLDIWAKLLL